MRLLLAALALLAGPVLAPAGASAAPPTPAPVPSPGASASPSPAPSIAPSPSPGAPASPSPAPAPLQATAKLSSDHPTFGDKLTLTVTLTYPENLRVFFPARPNLKPLLTIPAEPGTTERKLRDHVVTETFTIPALVAKSGLLRTPPIEVPYHYVTAGGGAGESGTVVIPSLRAVARSQFAGATRVEPEPLPEPLPLVEENTPLQVGLLVLAMMLVAAALTFVGLRAYRHRVHRRTPAPEIPPHLLAYGRIEELLRSDRLQGEPRLVFGEINAILRQYLGGRYGIPALDMTSTELLSALPELDLRGLVVDRFREFTELSDLVKFARLGRTAEEMEHALRFVREVVDRTMQTPEEMERLKQERLARLARQQRLRLQVMAPAPLRLQAFALDFFGGALVTFLVAWLAIDTGKQSLFDAAYALLWVWLLVRDVIGGGSPGKAITGLQIAEFDPDIEVDPAAVLREKDAAIAARAAAVTAGLWPRLQRNLLLIVPGAGIVAEGLTCLYLPELRRLGDQWAETRVIDSRYGLRRGRVTWTAGILMAICALVVLALPFVGLGGRPL